MPSPDLKSPDSHLVFSQTVEAFLRDAFGDKMTPALQLKIKAVGIDLSKPLDPAYPLAIVEDAIELVAHEAFPALPRPQALVKLGRLQIEAFSRTLIGRATIPVFKVLVRDDLRSLKWIARGFRQANNYVETRVERVGEGHYRLWFNDAGRLPEVIQGILEGGSAMVGSGFEVRIAERKGLECWFEVKRKQG
jgi:uncharacterized protein (TIGR02265 family)